ncbi:hypothetical protein ACVWY9_001283 [Thermostichus sp. OS-CIW-31]
MFTLIGDPSPEAKRVRSNSKLQPMKKLQGS